MNKFIRQCLKNVGIAVFAMTVVISIAFVAIGDGENNGGMNVGN